MSWQGSSDDPQTPAKHADKAATPGSGAEIYRYITFYMLSARGKVESRACRSAGMGTGQKAALGATRNSVLPEIGCFHLWGARLAVDNLRAQDNLKILLVACSLCCLFEKRQVAGIG